MAFLREQIGPLLFDRREKLATMSKSAPRAAWDNLRREVDLAIRRLEENRYGACEVCGSPIGDSDLLANPLLRSCISHLPADEQRKIYRDQGFAESLRGVSPLDDVRGLAIETEGDVSPRMPLAEAPLLWAHRKELDLDLDRARQIVSALLPATHLHSEAWEVSYEYVPAGPLGGDFCDLVQLAPGEFFLLFGDVMGKGIAACMIASRLYGLFRTLLDLNLSLSDMLDRANRIFCEFLLSSGQYATLVCGRTTNTGTLEVVNAGHLPPLLLGQGRTERIVATGPPLGLFFSSTYEVTRIDLEAGDTLLLFTDGLTEERDPTDSEYGYERLTRFAVERKHLSPDGLVRVCREEVAAFAGKSVFSDDLTLLAMRRLSEKIESGKKFDPN